MSLEGYIGLTGPEYEMDVERGKIREFAKASHAPIRHPAAREIRVEPG